ncbi:MAG: hypothetical protein IPJ47_07140 [Anaerolineales bacterium]|nr:hypothetical protein [Anaerolineales bacterium]
MEKIPQEKLPSRQLLQNDRARSPKLLDWLNTPSGGSTRAIRMEFITRLYFLKMYFPKKITRHSNNSVPKQTRTFSAWKPPLRNYPPNKYSTA